MVNRKEKQLQEFKELINRDWQLSLDEDEFLDSVLNLLLSRETKKAAEIVNFFYSEEWENLLELIPDREIEYYAEKELGMITSDEGKTLDDFSEREIVDYLKDEYFDFIDEVEEEEMINHLENKGYYVSDERAISNDYDYVDSCLFEDIVSVFDSLSVFDRQKLRDLVINNFK